MWPVASGVRRGTAGVPWLRLSPLLGPRRADHHRAALHDGRAGRGHGQAAVCGGGRKREHPMVQVRLFLALRPSHLDSYSPNGGWGWGGPPLCRTLLPPAPLPLSTPASWPGVRGRGYSTLLPLWGSPPRTTLFSAGQATHQSFSSLALLRFWADSFGCRGASGGVQPHPASGYL